MHARCSSIFHGRHTSSESSSPTNSPVHCAKPVFRAAATPLLACLVKWTRLSRRLDGRDEFLGRIRRTIVDHDDFEIAVRLRQSTIECPLQAVPPGCRLER